MRFTAETRVCLKCENFTPAYMNGGRYDRTDDFLRTKISWLPRKPIFFTHGALAPWVKSAAKKASNFYAFSLKTIKTQAV